MTLRPRDTNPSRPRRRSSPGPPVLPVENDATVPHPVNLNTNNINAKSEVEAKAKAKPISVGNVTTTTTNSARGRNPNSRPRPPLSTSTMQTLRGIPVSPGIAISAPLVLDPGGLRPPHRLIEPDAVAAEIDRLTHALNAARTEAEAAEAEARRRLGPQYADILGAHARMIDDPGLLRDAKARIERDGINAEAVVADILDGYAARLEAISDSHLAARAADVRDIRQRILRQFLGEKPPAKASLPGAGPVVILAHDLSPSETADLDTSRVLGFATEAGGRASHTAIVAEALEIPAVVGLGRFLDQARLARMVIIDGDEGLVILDPDPETLDRYHLETEQRAARFLGLAELTDLPAVTLDGQLIELSGNIEFPAEAPACLERGAHGVGLYRTEFLFLNADRPPTEDEQFASYKAVVLALEGKPIVIRTLDLGADKLASYQLGGFVEQNPALGLRSLRLSLHDPSLFRVQLRAILRAATLGDVRVMFPLVSTVGEVRHARRLLKEAAAELVAEGVACRPDLPVGVMIEVPAAAIMADALACEVDFFSIGTNDLTQYALAVDRSNESVAGLYNAADPAVVRLIAMVVKAAEAQGIPVSVCGTMGGEPIYALLLLGLGLCSLSMPPHQLPEMKRVVRAIRLDDARVLAAEALRQDTAAGVVALLQDGLRHALPEP